MPFCSIWLIILQTDMTREWLLIDQRGSQLVQAVRGVVYVEYSVILRIRSYEFKDLILGIVIEIRRVIGFRRKASSD